MIPRRIWLALAPICVLMGCGQLDDETARSALLGSSKGPTSAHCTIPRALTDAYKKDAVHDGRPLFCIEKDKADAARCASALISAGVASDAPDDVMKDMALRGRSMDDFMRAMKYGGLKIDLRRDVYAVCWTWDPARSGLGAQDERWIDCGRLDDVQVESIERSADDLARVKFHRQLVADPKMKEAEAICGALTWPKQETQEAMLLKQDGRWIAKSGDAR